MVYKFLNTPVFTKLYLHSAYNLVHVRQGSDLKMAFSTLLATLQYCVRLYRPLYVSGLDL